VRRIDAGGEPSLLLRARRCFGLEAREERFQTLPTGRRALFETGVASATACAVWAGVVVVAFVEAAGSGTAQSPTRMVFVGLQSGRAGLFIRVTGCHFGGVASSRRRASVGCVLACL